MRIWKRVLAPLSVALLAGCASAPPAGTTGTESATSASPTTRAGDVIVSAVGTPFLIALKAPVCGASIVIAAPLAAIAGLAEGRRGSQVLRDLGEGVGRNCGPPYVVSPARD